MVQNVAVCFFVKQITLEW